MYKMGLHENIQEAYKSSASYPELVEKLIRIVIESYTVEVATGTVLYRTEGGNTVLHEGEAEPREIAKFFNLEQILKAGKETQLDKTDYTAFINDIAWAGVRFYEATLAGDNKRVTYIGHGGFYEERIPFSSQGFK